MHPQHGVVQGLDDSFQSSLLGVFSSEITETKVQETSTPFQPSFDASCSPNDDIDDRDDPENRRVVALAAQEDDEEEEEEEEEARW